MTEQQELQSVRARLTVLAGIMQIAELECEQLFDQHRRNGLPAPVARRLKQLESQLGRLRRSIEALLAVLHRLLLG